jgi:hypothetical protein
MLCFSETLRAGANATPLTRAKIFTPSPSCGRSHDRRVTRASSLSLPVIYISHDMTEIERLADHLVLMQSGAVLAAGPLGALQSDPSLLAAGRDAAVNFDERRRKDHAVQDIIGPDSKAVRHGRD